MSIPRSQIQKTTILRCDFWTQYLLLKDLVFEKWEDFIFCRGVLEPDSSSVGGFEAVVRDFGGVEVVPAMEKEGGLDGWKGLILGVWLAGIGERKKGGWEIR
jgi:hypothetical protein